MKQIIFVLLMVLSMTAEAAEYGKLQADMSSITFISKQMNVAVEGSFKKFTATVKINPAKVDTGKAHVEVDAGSIDAGGEEANEEVKGKNWFDVKTYPVSAFELGAIKSLGNGKYEASGKMTIKGKTLPISVPFNMKEEKNLLQVDGTFGIRRLEYGLGSGVWGDTSVVADEVQIKFHLVFK